MPIDILIGSRDSWSPIDDKVIWRMNGPIAISSKVGCILSGPIDNNDPIYLSTGIVKTHILRIESEHMQEKKYLNKSVKKCFNFTESYD